MEEDIEEEALIVVVLDPLVLSCQWPFLLSNEKRRKRRNRVLSINFRVLKKKKKRNEERERERENRRALVFFYSDFFSFDFVF